MRNTLCLRHVPAGARPITSQRTAFAGLIAVLAALGVAAIASAAVAPGDHYMCYAAKLSSSQPKFVPSTLSLQDEFGAPQSYVAKKYITICNPADTSGELPQHPLVHQLGLQIAAPPGTPKVAPQSYELDDQFGHHSLTIKRPDSFLTLSAQTLGTSGATPLASTEGVDQFKCYKVGKPKGSPPFVPPASPTVTDELVNGQAFDLKKPTHVCTPVDDGSTPGAPTHTGHLLCYRAKLAKGAPKLTPSQVSVNSLRFGNALLDVLKPTELCVPAMRNFGCDWLDPSVCMFPFPNDWFTVADATTDTGRRVDFQPAAMPKNAAHVPIAVADYNLSDGFSPGASILLHVPGIDLTVTGAAPITDLARSLDTNAPIVLVNASTLAHHLQWAETDSNATSEATRSLIIRPAVNFDEGTRYIVALRNLKDSSGTLISPTADFTAYRDNIPTGDPYKEARRAHMEELFSTLEAAGVGRSDLYLAWDFTVASRRNITERLLFARDDAFTRLGTAAPAFTVTQVQNDVDSDTYRRVTGTYNVERYVDATTPGARMVLGADGLPLHQSTPQVASFICNIPRAALPSATAHATPARASLYGHGLFGSSSEVSDHNVEAMGNEHNFVFCATTWIGISADDLTNVGAIFQDLSKFPSFTDRLQQAIVDQLFLARLMIHPQGLSSAPAFQDSFGAPVLDLSAVFYDGNSTGGILGGTVMAVAQDITRGVLGVPGMNYSLMLPRSTDFIAFSPLFNFSYPDELTRPLDLALIQMLWDRSDPNGYAHHITTDPLPNTPAHTVLLHLAFGDHQVANVATEIEARTIGASIHQPAIAAGRNPDVTPYYGIPAIATYPFDGSALIVWDSGAAPPPTTNTAPSLGPDPHSDPRNSAVARQQKSDFLRTGGTVVDVCSGTPCTIP